MSKEGEELPVGEFFPQPVTGEELAVPAIVPEPVTPTKNRSSGSGGGQAEIGSGILSRTDPVAVEAIVPQAAKWWIEG